MHKQLNAIVSAIAEFAQLTIVIVGKAWERLQDFISSIFSMPNRKGHGRVIIPYRPKLHRLTRATSRTEIVPVRQIEYTPQEVKQMRLHRRTPYPKVKRPASTIQPNTGKESA